MIQHKLERWMSQGYTDNDTPLDDYGKEVLREVVALVVSGADTAGQLRKQIKRLEHELLMEVAARVDAPAAPALPPACLCCLDGCQDGCACKDMTRSDDESPRGRGALPPVEADTDLSALEQIDYVRRMLHWHTGPTAPAPYRGDHWAGEIDRLDAALEMLAPGRFTPLAMKPAPVEADTMPTIEVGDRIVFVDMATVCSVRPCLLVERDDNEVSRADVREIDRGDATIWRRPSPQEAT